MRGEDQGRAGVRADREVAVESLSPLSPRQSRRLPANDTDAEADGVDGRQDHGLVYSTWVQCFICCKWRRVSEETAKLFADLDWTCSLNFEDRDRMHCEAAEEVEPVDGEGGEQLTATAAAAEEEDGGACVPDIGGVGPVGGPTLAGGRRRGGGGRAAGHVVRTLQFDRSVHLRWFAMGLKAGKVAESLRVLALVMLRQNESIQRSLARGSGARGGRDSPVSSQKRRVACASGDDDDARANCGDDRLNVGDGDADGDSPHRSESDGSNVGDGDGDSPTARNAARATARMLETATATAHRSQSIHRFAGILRSLSDGLDAHGGQYSPVSSQKRRVGRARAGYSSGVDDGRGNTPNASHRPPRIPIARTGECTGHCFPAALLAHVYAVDLERERVHPERVTALREKAGVPRLGYVDGAQRTALARAAGVREYILVDPDSLMAATYRADCDAPDRVAVLVQTTPRHVEPMITNRETNACRLLTRDQACRVLAELGVTQRPPLEDGETLDLCGGDAAGGSADGHEAAYAVGSSTALDGNFMLGREYTLTEGLPVILEGETRMVHTGKLTVVGIAPATVKVQFRCTDGRCCTLDVLESVMHSEATQAPPELPQLQSLPMELLLQIVAARVHADGWEAAITVGRLLTTCSSVSSNGHAAWRHAAQLMLTPLLPLLDQVPAYDLGTVALIVRKMRAVQRGEIDYVGRSCWRDADQSADDQSAECAEFDFALRWFPGLERQPITRICWTCTRAAPWSGAAGICSVTRRVDVEFEWVATQSWPEGFSMSSRGHTASSCGHTYVFKMCYQGLAIVMHKANGLGGHPRTMPQAAWAVLSLGDGRAMAPRRAVLPAPAWHGPPPATASSSAPPSPPSSAPPSPPSEGGAIDGAAAVPPASLLERIGRAIGFSITPKAPLQAPCASPLPSPSSSPVPDDPHHAPSEVAVSREVAIWASAASSAATRRFSVAVSSA